MVTHNWWAPICLLGLSAWQRRRACLDVRRSTIEINLFQKKTYILMTFSNSSCRFLNPKLIFSNLIYNFSNVVEPRNLQEQVKKAFCYQKLFWPFTLQINFSSDLKDFKNSWPSVKKFLNPFCFACTVGLLPCLTSPQS